MVHLYLNFIKLLIVFLRISDKIRKSINKTVQSVAMDLGFNIKNLDEIRSRRKFNKYIIDYGKSFTRNSLKEDIIVEIALQVESFPVETSRYNYSGISNRNK